MGNRPRKEIELSFDYINTWKPSRIGKKKWKRKNKKNIEQDIKKRREVYSDG